MDKTVIRTEDAPAAIGPYSQAIAVSDLVFCSGQIPLDPQSGEMVGEGDVGRQTERVMENLRAVLGAAGCDFSRVVKATVYVTDLADFAVVNQVYGRYFEADPPARATVQVAALPRGARVEVEVIAVRRTDR